MGRCSHSQTGSVIELRMVSRLALPCECIKSHVMASDIVVNVLGSRSKVIVSGLVRQ